MLIIFRFLLVNRPHDQDSFHILVPTEATSYQAKRVLGLAARSTSCRLGGRSAEIAHIRIPGFAELRALRTTTNLVL